MGREYPIVDLIMNTYDFLRPSAKNDKEKAIYKYVTLNELENLKRQLEEDYNATFVDRGDSTSRAELVSDILKFLHDNGYKLLSSLSYILF